MTQRLIHAPGPWKLPSCAHTSDDEQGIGLPPAATARLRLEDTLSSRTSPDELTFLPLPSRLRLVVIEPPVHDRGNDG